MKYSIWIVPHASVYFQLKKVIDILAQKYDGPTFEPHMTILGSFEIEVDDLKTKIKELAKRTKPLELTLDSVSFSTTYFQSVFVRVNSTAALMNLNIELKELLGVENNVFMPHISLLYGDHDMHIREKAASEIRLKNLQFIASELTIIPADSNDPKDWKKIATYPLNG